MNKTLFSKTILNVCLLFVGMSTLTQPVRAEIAASTKVEMLRLEDFESGMKSAKMQALQAALETEIYKKLKTDSKFKINSKMIRESLLGAGAAFVTGSWFFSVLGEVTIMKAAADFGASLVFLGGSAAAGGVAWAIVGGGVVVGQGVAAASRAIGRATVEGKVSKDEMLKLEARRQALRAIRETRDALIERREKLDEYHD